MTLLATGQMGLPPGIQMGGGGMGGDGDETHYLEELTAENLDERIADSELLVLLAYEYQAGQAASGLEAAAGELLETEGLDSPVSFAKIDAAEHKLALAKYKIHQFPTRLFFRRGELRPFNTQRQDGPGIAEYASPCSRYHLHTADERLRTSALCVAPLPGPCATSAVLPAGF